MKSYLVMGHTGEYSDYYEWLVVNYTDLERARQHKDLANDWAKQFGGTYWTENWEESSKQYHKRVKVNGGPYDPELRIDYTGAWYTVMVVDLDPEDFEGLERVKLLEEVVL